MTLRQLTELTFVIVTLASVGALGEISLIDSLHRAVGDAAMLGDANEVQRLVTVLGDTFDANWRDPATYPAVYNDTKLTCFLVKNPTAAHRAVSCSNLTDGDMAKVVKLLVEIGASVDVKESSQKLTPIAMASKHGFVNTTRVLLDASLSPVDRSGRTPLMEAAADGNLAIVKLLVDRGASVNVKNAENKTALHLAALANQTEIATFLLGKGGSWEGCSEPLCYPDFASRAVSLESLAYPNRFLRGDCGFIYGASAYNRYSVFNLQFTQGPFERFQIRPRSPGSKRYVIESLQFTRRFIRVDCKKEAAVCRYGPDETVTDFTVEWNTDDGTLSFQIVDNTGSDGGLYLSADGEGMDKFDGGGGGRIRCSSTKSKAERFRVTLGEPIPPSRPGGGHYGEY